MGSATILILGLPIFVLVALLVKTTSPGPIFFVQERLGINGSVFKLFKFRTMIENAEKMGTGLFSYEDDPRITRVGNFLRNSSLDELPQLINVFLGDMSLVGPRPAVTYELGEYSELPARAKIRFRVKPGITGLAQVSGRNDLNWDQKIKLDNRYIALRRKMGIFLDLKILFQTVWIVLRRDNTIESHDNSPPSFLEKNDD